MKIFYENSLQIHFKNDKIEISISEFLNSEKDYTSHEQIVKRSFSLRRFTKPSDPSVPTKVNLKRNLTKKDSTYGAYTRVLFNDPGEVFVIHDRTPT